MSEFRKAEFGTISVGIDDTTYSIANYDGFELPDQIPFEELRQHPLLITGVSKLQWGERHLRALKHNIDAFFADSTNRAVLRADLDAESGYHIFRVQSAPDLTVIREHFHHAVADAAQSIRAALDQFAWQLACDFVGGTPLDEIGVHFPIREDPQEFVDKERRARKQFDPRHWEFFERFQPYHGLAGRADGWLGPYVHQLTLLSELSNNDKHRATEPVLLIPHQYTLRVAIDGTPQEVQGHEFVLPDWKFDHAGEALELDAEVMRARLVQPAEPHIDDAGEMTPHVALAERRGAVTTLARLGYYVHLMFSEFARDFPPEP